MTSHVLAICFSLCASVMATPPAKAGKLRGGLEDLEKEANSLCPGDDCILNVGAVPSYCVSPEPLPSPEVAAAHPQDVTPQQWRYMSSIRCVYDWNGHPVCHNGNIIKVCKFFGLHPGVAGLPRFIDKQWDYRQCWNNGFHATIEMEKCPSSPETTTTTTGVSSGADLGAQQDDQLATWCAQFINGKPPAECRGITPTSPTAAPTPAPTPALESKPDEVRAPAAPVGMWVERGRYFKSKVSRDSKIEICTQDSKGQLAQRSQIETLANQVETSLFVKKMVALSPLGLKAVEVKTTWGIAYKVSKETKASVYSTIKSSSSLTQCRHEKVSCDKACWMAMENIQPGTFSAALWQWVVKQQDSEDPIHSLGTFLALPNGMTPFCPPGTQVVGDMTMTNCRDGTFASPSRRLSEPMHFVV